MPDAVEAERVLAEAARVEGLHAAQIEHLAVRAGDARI